eukprot:jgi/Picre1/28980/NNA_004374.t1
MLNSSAKGSQPRGEEAVRILSFFMGSMKNPTLQSPPSLDEMLSWTVLTPHYHEDVLYALNRKEVATYFGMQGSDVSKVSDLVNPNDDGVTVMAWLRSNYSHDWDNMLERLKPALTKANIDAKSVREADFDEGAPLAAHRMELLQWASYRGQHLSRTVRGMMAYEKALRLLAKIENPNPGVSALRYNSSIDDLVRSKFSQWWHLRIMVMQGNLVNQNKDGLPGVWRCCFTSILDFAARHGTPINDPQCTEELYRIRLPVNRLQSSESQKGIILGEGKPENQNASIIYCFGEAIQAIDMNQDNYLFEALKMRNLIDEFNPPRYTDDTWKTAIGPYARRNCGPDKVAIKTKAEVTKLIQNGHAPSLQMEDVTTDIVAYERPWPDMRSMPVT